GARGDLKSPAADRVAELFDQDQRVWGGLGDEGDRAGMVDDRALDAAVAGIPGFLVENETRTAVEFLLRAQNGVGIRWHRGHGGFVSGCLLMAMASQVGGGNGCKGKQLR